MCVCRVCVLLNRDRGETGREGGPKALALQREVTLTPSYPYLPHPIQLCSSVFLKFIHSYNIYIVLTMSQALF